MKEKRENIYFILFLLFFTSLFLCINITKAKALIFSEIMYDPQGSDSGNEWVEIFNNSSSTILISSDYRFNNGSNHIINLILGENSIDPETFFIITNNSSNFLNKYSDYNSVLFESSFSLNNSSGVVKILQGTNLLAEQFYDNSIGANDNGRTIERINLFTDENIWQESYVLDGTPGLFSSTKPPNVSPVAIINISTTTVYVEENIFFDASYSTDENGDELFYLWNIDNITSSTEKIFNYSFSDAGAYNIELTVSDGFLSDSTSTMINVLENNITEPEEYVGRIVINELLPNPEGSDDTEWIEIKNIGNIPIDLENWYIQDESSKKYIFSKKDFSNLILSPDEFLVLHYSVSKIVLNNSSDKLYLFDCYDRKVFEIFYSNSVEGNSFARFDDSWQWTNILTPGEENQRKIVNMPVAVIEILGEAFTGNEITFSATDSSDPKNEELSYKWYINNYLKSKEEQFKITFDTKSTKNIKLIVTNVSGFSSEAFQTLEILELSEQNINNSCNHESSIKIIISEIFPNPKGVDDGEFIELYNPNDFEIDLTNWSLNDTSTRFYKLSTIIPGRSFIVIHKKDSKISLNNSNEELTLYDCNKQIIWNLKYEKSIEDKSYSYNFFDEQYFWSDPTPEEDNFYESILENNEFIISGVDINLEENEYFYGVVISILNEIKSGVFYVCAYDIYNEFINYEECVESKSKLKSQSLKKGDVVVLYGGLKESDNKKFIKASDLEIIKNIKLREGELFEIEDIFNLELNSFAFVEGEIIKLNKKSFYIGTEDSKLKIKFQDIGDLKLNKSDNVIISGIVVKDGSTKAIYIRDKNDILIQQVLGEHEIATSTNEIGNFKEESNSFVGILIIISAVLIVGFYFLKNKIIQNKKSSPADLN